MIWVYALGSDIWYTSDRFRPRRKTNTAHFTHKLRNGFDYEPSDHGLALLLTCKQIHSEAHNIPLTRSTFAFESLQTFASWAGHPMARFVTSAEVLLDALPENEYEGPEAGMIRKISIFNWRVRFEKSRLCSRSRFPALRHFNAICESPICFCQAPKPTPERVRRCLGMYEDMVKEVELSLRGDEEEVALSIVFRFSIRHCETFMDKTMPRLDCDGCGDSVARTIRMLLSGKSFYSGSSSAQWRKAFQEMERGSD